MRLARFDHAIRTLSNCHNSIYDHRLRVNSPAQQAPVLPSQWVSPRPEPSRRSSPRTASRRAGAPGGCTGPASPARPRTARRNGCTGNCPGAAPGTPARPGSAFTLELQLFMYLHPIHRRSLAPRRSPRRRIEPSLEFLSAPPLPPRFPAGHPFAPAPGTPRRSPSRHRTPDWPAAGSTRTPEAAATPPELSSC